MSLVGLAKAEDNSIVSIEQAILDSLNSIKYTFPQAKNIVIKPNLCYYLDYSTGHTTAPQFIEALITLLRRQISKNVNISLIESDASAMKCKHVFPLLGYDKIAREQNVKLVNLAEEENEPINLSVNGSSYSLLLPRLIKEADLRINVPKIKYMNQIGISCAMKNIYGCNPIAQKYKFHKLLAETIVGLNKIMKFDLHILDGIIIAGITPKKMNLVMASQDPVAFDSIAARIAGINPKKVKSITLGQKEGVGKMKYNIQGAELDLFAKNYPKPSTRAKILTHAYLAAVKTGLLSKEFL
jgi:uncharacterized protein (DUF362 family)